MRTVYHENVSSDLAAALAEMQQLRTRIAGRAGVVLAGRDAPKKLDTFQTILVGPLAVPRTFRAFYTTFDRVDGVAAPLSALAKALKAQWRAGRPLRAPLAPGRELVLPDDRYDGELAGGERFLDYLRSTT
jgi:hypothetical protein